MAQPAPPVEQILKGEELRLKPTVHTPALKVNSELPAQQESKPAVALSSTVVSLEHADIAPWNSAILAAIKDMPSGGTYSTKQPAMDCLKASLSVDKETPRLKVNGSVAKPSFCSGATYLVLVETLRRLQASKTLTLSLPACDAIAQIGAPDGVGVWGRWNANGPGTAALFYQLGAGRSFTSFEDARPGDFLKIWWNEHIGSKERGHSVIYLGGGKNDEVGPDKLKFWSSNVPDGYGTKTIPIGDAKRVLFTRLDNPQALENGPRIETKDNFLASMLKRTASEAEMFRQSGIAADSNRTASTPRVVVITPSSVGLSRVAAGNGETVVRAIPVAEKATGSLLRQKMFEPSSYAKCDNVTQIRILRQIQTRLVELGFYKGKPDGAVGPATLAAITAFQSSIKQDPTGQLQEATVIALGVESYSSPE
jgi:hypothetical protein